MLSWFVTYVMYYTQSFSDLCKPRVRGMWSWHVSVTCECDIWAWHVSVTRITMTRVRGTSDHDDPDMWPWHAWPWFMTCERDTHDHDSWHLITRDHDSWHLTVTVCVTFVTITTAIICVYYLYKYKHHCVTLYTGATMFKDTKSTV